ncbi:MAG: amidohydrolase family protein [Acidimicrobiales bacterium]|nr:amidohydrolase family protein [Acidimicrobiales bacterium]MYH73777.1 amidohydrolase family protein [Acidimicrobiales bacterium]MYK72948.1 amidohydrolase family protein [Acidimicrobiales bacterium]
MPDDGSPPADGGDGDDIAVIDFRFRPIGARSWTPETTYHYLERMGLEPCPSFEAQSVDLMFTEMDEAGIALGVIGVPGPTDIRGLDPTASAEIRQIVSEHPDRFVGFGSVEPSDIGAAVSAVGELARQGMRGVTVDPSTAQISRRFNDRDLYPIYEEAQRLGLIVSTTMSCLLGPYQDDCRPEYADHVATDFPGLTISIQHGGWPYVRETLGVLYKQPNVVTVPGQYVHYGFPGSEDYVTALTRQLPDQILFGSVYPNCGPLTDLRRIVARWKLPPHIERKYLRDNAARVLGL